MKINKDNVGNLFEIKNIKYYIIAFFTIALVVFLFFYLKPSQNPDLGDWQRASLENNIFAQFLPLSLNKSSIYLASLNEDGSNFKKIKENPSDVFIESKGKGKIQIDSKYINFESSSRAIYGLAGFDDLPLFKAWIEKITPTDFLSYKSSLVKEINGYEDVDIYNSSHKGVEYSFYLRKDLSSLGLEGKSSIGGAYIFMPEEYIVEYLYFINTRYNISDAYLISKEEIIKLIENLIDYSNSKILIINK